MGRRVEVFSLVAAPHGGPLLVPGDPPRLPGVVLRHGERPRDAAVRAVAGLADVAAEELRLREVVSDVLAAPGGSRVHVLRAVFEAPAGAVPAVDPDLLAGATGDPPAAAPAPGAPPQVQRPAAYVSVVRDGRALLTRITGHGAWTLPGGGIDHGEHPHDAVRRETREETGLELSTARLVDVDSRHFTGRSPAQVTEDFHGVRFIYHGTVLDRRDPVVEEVGGTTDAAAWVPLEELGRLRLTDVARNALRPQP